ncbi:MAG: transglycosylase SLT domain-containing protein [Myxococcales bacterium]|nr:transglycosylase SLT domain-containing protein [Myxococcales bacterium]MCB9643639.1 transglycosylase SLT domain-containing protein [Myxococcales bacterium]
MRSLTRFVGILGMGALCSVGCKTRNTRDDSVAKRPIVSRRTVPLAKKETQKATTPVAKTVQPAAPKAPSWTLEPYLESEKTQVLRRYLAQGDCQNAADEMAKKKHKPAIQRASWIMLGRCWFKKQSWGLAREAFAKIAKPKEDLLADYLAYWEARSWQEEKILDKAIAAFLTIPSDSKLYKIARLQAAEFLLGEKQHSRLIEVLEGEIFEKEPTAWWLTARARWALRKKSQRKLALASLRRLLVERPASWQTKIATNWLKGRKIRLELNNDERLLQAYRLNRVFAYRAALEVMKGVRLSAKSPRTQQCKLRFARGFAWFRLRRYRDALRDLVPAAKLCKGLAYEEVRVLFRLGQSYRRLGRVSPSIRWMRRLAARYPKHYLADDAIFNVAELLERSKREDAAKKTYARLLRDFPKGDMALYARWRLAYQAYRGGRWDEAKGAFKSMYTRFRKEKYAPGSLYFAARTAQNAAGKLDSPEAEKLYTKLVQDHPLHYYSFLGVERLVQLRKRPWRLPELPIVAMLNKHGVNSDIFAVKPPTEPVQLAQLPWGPRWIQEPKAEDIRNIFAQKKLPAFVDSDPYKKGAELYRLDMDDLAASEWLRLINCNTFPGPNKKPRRWRCALYPDPGSDFLAMHFRLAGQYHLADRFFRRRGTIAGNIAFSGNTAHNWYLAYPLAFWDEVKTQATRNKMDPAMVYGVMREESTFNPRTQSFSNAYGLMQLIMPTAKQVARRVFPGRSMNPETLYQPEVNIALGTRYLRMLLAQFKRAPVAIPGYNAGPAWVNRWLRRNPQLPFDEWVEAISIQQTRRYARYVLQTYSIYRFLYGHLMTPPRPMLSIHPWFRPGSLLKR